MELNNQTTELFKEKFKTISAMNWVENRRHGNDGGVGNTLEDLLEIVENNLSLPDFGKWELKTQRDTTSSLLTLFHCEPEPREARFVSKIALPNYGWKHNEAGSLYGENERSFRATLKSTFSDRGLRVGVDRTLRQVYVEFDAAKISDSHFEWKTEVKAKIGLDDFNPRPYWSFYTIEKKLQTKLDNLLYFRVETKKENGKEFYRYSNFEAYMKPTLDNFLKLVDDGVIYVDFDARTKHNHGTKIRIKSDQKKNLYSGQIEI
ncbi:MAG: MvaI/BcnI family restriction endonuclease [Clostridiales bacterium]|jgi:hypothetical protein|nr:MvaI/BcnI family restriction endonuclease [Clostridiales bacterium]